MAFGSCVIVEGAHTKRLTPQAAFIHGSLHGEVAIFVMRQEFRHNRRCPMDVDYIVANNLNLCMYDTTFYVGDHVIKPQVEEKSGQRKSSNQQRRTHERRFLDEKLGTDLFGSSLVTSRLVLWLLWK